VLGCVCWASCCAGLSCVGLVLGWAVCAGLCCAGPLLGYRAGLVLVLVLVLGWAVLWLGLCLCLCWALASFGSAKEASHWLGLGQRDGLGWALCWALLGFRWLWLAEKPKVSESMLDRS